MHGIEIKILQIRDIENCNYAFMDYHFAQRHGFSLDDYEEVYSFDYKPTQFVSGNRVLEDVYYIFNVVNKPKDFKGHSLSVSDIIVKDGEMFYVDSIGFAKVN